MKQLLARIEKERLILVTEDNAGKLKQAFGNNKAIQDEQKKLPDETRKKAVEFMLYVKPEDRDALIAAGFEADSIEQKRTEKCTMLHKSFSQMSEAELEFWMYGFSLKHQLAKRPEKG